MRRDMAKVIAKNGKKIDEVYVGNRRADWADIDSEDAASFEPMRAGIKSTKKPVANAKPLIKFLKSRTGQSWDEIYAEMMTDVGGGAEAKETLRKTLNDLINPLAVMVDGHPVLPGKDQTAFFGFYIEPISKVLRFEEFAVEPVEKEETKRVRFMIGTVAYNLIDGIWYKHNTPPDDIGPHWNKLVAFWKKHNKNIDGKRQVNGKELKRLGLINQPKQGLAAP